MEGVSVKRTHDTIQDTIGAGGGRMVYVQLIYLITGSKAKLQMGINRIVRFSRYNYKWSLTHRLILSINSNSRRLIVIQYK